MYKYILLLLLPCFVGCAAFFPKHSRSHFNEGEKVSIVLTKETENPKLYKRPDSLSLDSPGAAAIAAVVIPFIAEQGVKQVQKRLEDEAEKYTEAYSKNQISTGFWKDNATHNIKEIIIERKVKVASEEKVAASFTFDLKTLKTEQIDERVFYLELSEAFVNYSKAKVPQTQPYLPWTYFYVESDDSVYVVIQLDIIANWSDSRNQSFEKTIASLKIGPLKMELGKKYKYASGEHKTLLFNSVPRSYLYTNKEAFHLFGSGTFSLQAKVTELNKYGEKLAEAAKQIEKNKDKIIEGITKGVLPE